MTALGADRVILRDADPLDSCGREVADVVVDVVGGSQWPALLDVISHLSRWCSVHEVMLMTRPKALSR